MVRKYQRAGEAVSIHGAMATGQSDLWVTTFPTVTTFKLREHGYRTIYLNERLSMGLAPESLSEFITQRSRWCLGTIQQVFTRWSFLGPARLPLILRVGLLDSVLYWFSGAIFKLMILLAPILYWFSGTTVIRARIPDLLYWMAPAVAASFLFTLGLSEKLVLPVIADVTQFLTMFSISRTVVQALVRPFCRKFKVTEKGISSAGYSVQWNLLSRFASIAILTILGMLIHTSSFSPYHGRPGYSLTVFWSLLNALLLFFASVVCVEPPKRRLDERFATNDGGKVVLEDGKELHCRFHDLSLGGACLIREDGWRSLVGPASLVLDQGRIAVPFGGAARGQKTGPEVPVYSGVAEATDRASIHGLLPPRRGIGKHSRGCARPGESHSFVTFASGSPWR